MSTTPLEDASGSIEVKEAGQDVSMTDGANDARGDFEDDGTDDGEHAMYRMIQQMTSHLSTVQEDGEELAAGFQRIPNRRTLPDYFNVIADPIAFSTIRGKIQKKQYARFSDFVKDIAQICHNAQVYNRPSAPIFGAAVRLREMFSQELQQLATRGAISTEDAKLPDLGELPPVENSPSLRSQDDENEDNEGEDEEEEEGEEDDDDDQEANDSSDDDDRPRKRRKGRDPGHRAFVSRKDFDDDKDEDKHRKRGRPPMVQTPTEARISSIIRGLRKFKDHDGNLLVLPFEKLPDKTVMAGYYQTISHPIALDNIKKKAKRKKYRDVDELQRDIELMFENAKSYNEDDSAVYLAAVELQLQSRLLAEQEKAKPDDDFRYEDGKLPLGEVLHDGQIWKVGDWVHIRNPNDLAKPVVAQIFRIWQDKAGQKWINACWYYRPEQTVHRHEKHFFEHEVVKTGQYRDHQINELLDRCFVMFVTRFNKGRPRGLPSDKDVYVCESRYNEEKFLFNKIKTWASCVPDEVREKDYEMDLFDVPHRMKKVPSPIKHLLREDAKETDELPRPTWGSPNAPPIVGAVHRRPPQPNESPPPDATPPPPVPTMTDVSADPVARPPTSSATVDMSMDSGVRDQHSGFPRPSPGSSSSPAQFSMAVNHWQAMPPGSVNHTLQQTPVPIPQPPQASMTPQVGMRPVQYQQPQPQQQQQQPQPQPQQQQQQQHTGYMQSFTPTFPQAAAPFSHPQTSANQPIAHYNQQRAHYNPPVASNTFPTNVYNPPRPPEVYTLPDNINDALDRQIRDCFHHGDDGRVLFFAGPPLDRPHKLFSGECAGMGHSVRYLAGRTAWLLDREKKRKRRSEIQKNLSELSNVSPHEVEGTGDALATQAGTAINKLFHIMGERTLQWQQTAGLEGWGNMKGDRED